MNKKPTYQPFPGLRAYGFQDTTYFSGRERQKHQLLKIIEENNFISVVGGNGVGKTSFVNCEIIPELIRGFNCHGKSHWKIASFRPGNYPLSSLATAISQVEVIRTDELEKIDPNLSEQFENILRNNNYGLIEIVEEHGLTENSNLLIYIDHLEDLLFHSDDSSAFSKRDVEIFIDRLVEVINQSAYSITVIMTLRTENVGHFSPFQELADVINKNQFLLSALHHRDLIPIFERISRDGQITFEPALIKHIQEHYKSNPLILGKFQHAMKRSIDQWRSKGKKGPVAVEHLKAAGGLGASISNQLDRIYENMSSPDKRTTQLMFQAITETSVTDTTFSVARRVSEISAIAGESSREIVKVAKLFADDACGVIKKYDPQDIMGRLEYLDHAGEPSEHLITEHSDITIAQDFILEEWNRLDKWIKEEYLNSNIYRDIAEDAERNDPPYEGEKLLATWKWYEENKPHAGWAQRYHKNFSLVEDFILKSKNLSDRERARRESEELSRQQKLKRNRNIKLAFSLVAFLLIVFAFIQTREASEAVTKANQQQEIAQTAEQQAEKAKEQAAYERRIAELSIRQASIESDLAQKAQDSAEMARIRAQVAQQEARQAQLRARQLREEARQLTKTVATKNQELGKAQEKIEESRIKEEYLGILEAVRDFSDESMKILNRTNTPQQREQAARLAAKGYDEYQRIRQPKYRDIKDTTREHTRNKLFSAMTLAYQKVGGSKQSAQINYGVALSKKSANSQVDGTGEFIIGTNDDNSSIFKIKINNGDAEKPVNIASAQDPEQRIMGISDLCVSNSGDHFLVSHLPIDQSKRYISTYDPDGNRLASKEVPSFIELIFPYADHDFLIIDQNGKLYMTEASAETLKSTPLYEANQELRAADFHGESGRLFLALAGGQVTVLDVSNGAAAVTEKMTFDQFDSEVSAIKYIGSKDWLLVGTRLGELYLFDATSKKCIYTSLSEHAGYITCLVLDQYEKHLVSGGRDKLLNIWDLEILATHTAGNTNVNKEYQPIEFSESESVRDASFVGKNWIFVVYSTKGLSTGRGGASLLPLDFDVTGTKLKKLVD